MSLRTPLGRVRGLGSAKDGSRHWWYQRLTAIALIPLGLWFLVTMIAYAQSDYASAVAWVRTPSTAVLLLLLVLVVFYHVQLGLQVVIEDYIHVEWAKLTMLISMKFSMLVLVTLSIYAILRVALGT